MTDDATGGTTDGTDAPEPGAPAAGAAPPPPAPTPQATPSPRPTPGPGRHAAPPADGASTSRRWFLAGTGAVVLAAGGGFGAAFLRDRDRAAAAAEPAPAELLAAAAAERALIADLDATTGGSADVRAVLTQVRADHAAHLRTLEALTTQYRRPAGGSATNPSPGTTAGIPRTAAALRAAEQRAARDAATRAAALDGRTAVLLASIAACEATHAELLG